MLKLVLYESHFSLVAGYIPNIYIYNIYNRNIVVIYDLFDQSSPVDPPLPGCLATLPLCPQLKAPMSGKPWEDQMNTWRR